MFSPPFFPVIPSPFFAFIYLVGIYYPMYGARDYNAEPPIRPKMKVATAATGVSHKGNKEYFIPEEEWRYLEYCAYKEAKYLFPNKSHAEIDELLYSAVRQENILED